MFVPFSFSEQLTAAPGTHGLLRFAGGAVRVGVRVRARVRAGARVRVRVAGGDVMTNK